MPSLNDFLTLILKLTSFVGVILSLFFAFAIGLSVAKARRQRMLERAEWKQDLEASEAKRAEILKIENELRHIEAFSFMEDRREEYEALKKEYDRLTDELLGRRSKYAFLFNHSDIYRYTSTLVETGETLVTWVHEPDIMERWYSRPKTFVKVRDANGYEFCVRRKAIADVTYHGVDPERQKEYQRIKQRYGHQLPAK